MLNLTLLYAALLLILGGISESYPLILLAALLSLTAYGMYLKKEQAFYAAIILGLIISFFLFMRLIELKHPILLLNFIISQIYLGFMLYKHKQIR